MGYYLLECIYDSRKSFYNKAKVKIEETKGSYKEILLSYNTEVASYLIDKETGQKTYYYNGYFSQTTTRHQKEFFKQKGLADKEIKHIIKKFKRITKKERGINL